MLEIFIKIQAKKILFNTKYNFFPPFNLLVGKATFFQKKVYTSSYVNYFLEGKNRGIVAYYLLCLGRCTKKFKKKFL